MTNKTVAVGVQGGGAVNVLLVDNGDGTYSLSTVGTVATGDIEIGAVELKNGADDTRAVIAAGTSIVAADPAVAVKDFTVGKTTDAAVVTDANGTLASFLRGIVKMLAASIAGTNPLAVSQAVVGKGVAVTLTRTADTSAYLASDTVGAATGSTAALTFAALLGAAGGEFFITTAVLAIQDTALISGEAGYNLELYNVTPPSALGDNVAWDLPSGDRAAHLETITFPTPIDKGSTLKISVDVNKQITLTGTDLFAYLVTNGAYTPSSGRVYKITLHGYPV